jgi:RepB DNA-primase from phage plasmid
VRPVARRVRQANALSLYLRALFGRDPGAFVEIAHRRERSGVTGPMHRGRTALYLPASDLGAVAEGIARLGRSEHVWVGVLPRRPHPKTGELGGTREHVAAARVLWVDCDSGERSFPLERLRAFNPPAHMVVASGGGYHAYWLLRERIEDLGRLREANERLARALGGDPQSADAARILRPPGTFNFKAKYPRPRPVELRFAAAHPLPMLEDIVGALPRSAAGRREVGALPRTRGLDPLQRIAPRIYFHALIGAEPDRAGKVSCPLPDHDDPGPSCHVYEAPAQGWYCFGCGRGGDIYELAGRLWGLRREGREFVELRDLLRKRFAVRDAHGFSPNGRGRR